MTSIGQSGPHTTKPGSARVFRGSKKRLARVRMRDNMSLEIWCFALVIAVILFVVVPWLVNHPDALHTHGRSTTDSGSADADSAHVR